MMVPNTHNILQCIDETLYDTLLDGGRTLQILGNLDIHFTETKQCKNVNTQATKMIDTHRRGKFCKQSLPMFTQK